MKSYILKLLLQLFLAGLLMGCLETNEFKPRTGKPPSQQVADQGRASPPSTPSTTPATKPADSADCQTLTLKDDDDDDDGDDDDDDDDGDDDDDDDDDDNDEDDNAGPAPTPTPTPTPGGCEPNPGQDTPGPNGALSFARDIAPILSRSCVSSNCHSTQRRADGVDMESFNGAQRSFGRSLRAIKNGSMPIGGFPRLNAAEIQQLELWQNQGFNP